MNLIRESKKERCFYVVTSSKVSAHWDSLYWKVTGCFVHLTACFNPRCDVFSENGPPVVATCRSGHLKLPFDPQPYLGGINDGGMNKRAILIHLALSESPVRDLLQQMVRALITADWLSRTSPLHENGSVLNALMQFWFVFINALIAKLN